MSTTESAGIASCTIDNVYLGHGEGVLKLLNESVSWRSKTTDSQKRIKLDDITAVRQAKLGSKYHLKFIIKNGKHVRFSGIRSNDYDLIKKYITEHYQYECEPENITSNGGNWGTMEIEGPNIICRVPDTNNGSSLEIPLEFISQCAIPSKNEVEIQFHEDDTVAADEDTLVEMRLYVPTGDDEVITGAEKLKNEIIDKAELTTVTGKCIVELDETCGTFVTPRGRYAVELYQNFLRMHGKTYDYKIMYNNINRCFLLDRPDGITNAFVISLEEPIRQGKQIYPHLVLQLRKEEITVDINLSKEKINEYNGNIKETMTNYLPELFATLFKFIINKKVYTSGKFYTHNNDRAVKCALKAMEGLLYPLEKSFLFIHKPTTFIRYEEIEFIEFQRYAGQSGATASRNFDLLVHCKSVGNEPGKEYLFAAIDRREFPELSQFLTLKKLKIRHLKEVDDNGSKGLNNDKVLDNYLGGPEEGEIDEDDEESEDSDFGPDKSDEDNDDLSDENLSGSASDSSSEDDDSHMIEDKNEKKRIKKDNQRNDSLDTKKKKKRK